MSEQEVVIFPYPGCQFHTASIAQVNLGMTSFEVTTKELPEGWEVSLNSPTLITLNTKTKYAGKQGENRVSIIVKDNS